MIDCPWPDQSTTCDNPGCRHGGCQGRPPLTAMAVHLIPCEACKSMGTVPHQKRTLGTDEHGAVIIDPHDHQTVELCSHCGGAGKAVAPKMT